jgi:malonyl-CoA/methylmalonyl-CoA synthetase
MAQSGWQRHLSRAADFSVAELTAGESVPALLGRRWAESPSVPVLWTAFDGRWCTAGELEERTGRAANVLANAGVRHGDRLLWSTPASLSAVIALLGAWRLGAVVVPMSPTYTEREVAHVVRDVRPRVAAVASAVQAGWVSAAASHALEQRRGAPHLGEDLPLLVAEAAGTDQRGGGNGSGGGDAGNAGAHDPALIVYTSGTTGAPKGAVLTHANLLAGTAALRLAWRWTPEDRLVLALPLCHVHGLVAGLLGTLVSGASAVVLERFDARAVLDAAAGQHGTLFFGVPTMYHRLLQQGRADELARLRLCVSGSAPLPEALWHRVRREAGATVLERYGMTETLLTISNPYEGERRAGTVGFPLPGVEIRLGPEDGDARSDSAGTPPTIGAEGELWLRGPSVFGGYWERPAATREAFSEGWFRTGDAVTVDADGYVAVRGRRRDLIISGGYNVYPAEVEDVLLGHRGVAEVAVAGVASEEWGEEVRAWVVPVDEAPSPGELLAFAAQRLASYKRPRSIRFVKELPRNSMGKLERERLRELP